MLAEMKLANIRAFLKATFTFLFCLQWLSTCLLLADESQEAEQLVAASVGELPIILSASHGGARPVPGVPQRQGNQVKSFNPLPDAGTAILTELLAEEIERLTGKRPYTVIAKFHRKYVDANRAEAWAYESEITKDLYHKYHRALADARREVIDRWGHGVLLDIHGQSTEPNSIFRGTVNGKTTKHLVNRFALGALVGQDSLFGHIARQGLSVVPAIDSTELEHPLYNGGFIVNTYGSRNGGTLDAVQLEIGTELRSKATRSETAKKLAYAVAQFANNYLPKTLPSYAPKHVNHEKTAVLVGLTLNSSISGDVTYTDEFADSKRDGWIELDSDSSTLTVQQLPGQLPSAPELNLKASDTSTLKEYATHFPPLSLDNPGDFVTLSFDARHDNIGFIDRGFRFGLFDSNKTRFKSDGEHGTNNVSLDDNGYFAMLDLGGSTTADSAVLRESNNNEQERLWEGGRIAFDAPDKTSDPLIFSCNKNYFYSLTLTRNTSGSIDIVLKNNASDERNWLNGTSKLTPTLKFDTIYFGTLGSTADFAIDNVMVTRGSKGERTVRDSDVRVGVYVDEGAGPSVNDLLFVLTKSAGVSVTHLNAEDIRSGKLQSLDLLMLPGGSGGGQGRCLGEDGRDAIRKFVDAGGGFVGICAGAYVASSDYTWSLNILDARVIDREHWNRGSGTVGISMTDAGRELLGAKNQKLSIHYAQGPLLAPGNRPDIGDFETLATFESEIAKNGAPEGVMKGTTAIARGKFGNGQVICFSPHPEMTNGLEQLVCLAIDHVKRDRKKQ